MGVLGGLLLKRPRCYDALGSGSLYREFESGRDIADTDNILERIIAVDVLLSRIPITVGRGAVPMPVMYRNLILTLWARDFLGLPEPLEAIQTDQFKSFFKQLFPSRKGSSKKKPAVSQPMQDSFFTYVSRKSDWPSEKFAGPLSTTFEEIFNDVAEQLGVVSPNDLDPRFIDLFLLE